MQVKETRLKGNEANLENITRFINRHVKDMPLARIELRYSTQSVQRLDGTKAKKEISKLLLEQGMGQAEVSVRPHEGALDDATGEHLVRLIPQSQSAAPAEDDDDKGWLPKLWPRKSQTQEAPPQPAQPQGLSAEQAVAMLRQAIKLSADDVKKVTGASRLVNEAQVIVRLDAANQVLGPLVLGELAQAAKSIAGMVRDQGFGTTPSFKVSYTHKPRTTTEGTFYAGDTDVEVLLLTAHSADERMEPSLDRNMPDTPPQEISEATALPIKQPAAPALTVRVLGTLQGNGTVAFFDKAFELRFSTLPARFDRSALDKAGFGSAHPELLAVASNSCPLTLDRGSDGQLHLHTHWRKTPDGSTYAMYRWQNTGVALADNDILTPKAGRLVVNDPHGVVNATTGRTLPALVVELLA